MKWSFKIILATLGLFIFACKKDTSVLGVDVQPTSDDLNAQALFDLPVLAHSLPYDSVACFNDRYKYIGSNNDPQFGRTDIGIYLNANMGVTNLDFGANSLLQEAEMILAVDPLQYAGDKTASLTYSVFPVTSSSGLNASTIYYTSNTRQHAANPISVHTTTFSIAQNGKPVIRIKIDSLYADGLFRDVPNLTSNEVFQAKYKGYYIAAGLQNGSEGVLFKADLEDDLSGFYLRYKPGTGTTDTLVNFKFTFSGARASRYNGVKFSPNPTLADHFQDTTRGASQLYLKGMGQSRLKIHIPFLKNHSDSFKVAVNRAELILYVDPSVPVSGYYQAPPKLTLLAIDSLGREAYVKDLLTNVDYSRYDGNYDESNKRYVFNIAREAQLIFSGQRKNNGFYVVVANTDLSLTTTYATATSKELLPVRRDNYIERIIIAGTGSAQKPKFNLNYIRFKND